MDPSSIDSLPKAEREELLGIIETMQTRDRCEARRARSLAAPHALPRSSLRMYNNLVERCFVTCVDSFRRKTLEKSEETARARRRPAPLPSPLTRPPLLPVRDAVLREVPEALSARVRSGAWAAEWRAWSSPLTQPSLQFAELNSGQPVQAE